MFLTLQFSEDLSDIAHHAQGEKLAVAFQHHLPDVLQKQELVEF